VYKFEGSTKTQYVVNDFLKKLDQFGARNSCVFYVTDTEPKMNAVGVELAKLGFQHIYCTDHTL